MGNCQANQNQNVEPPVKVQRNQLRQYMDPLQKHKFKIPNNENIPHTQTNHTQIKSQKITDFIIKNEAIDILEYRQICSKVQNQNNGPYFDPDFPAILNSIGGKKFKDISWKRAGEFIEGSHTVFSGSIDPKDIHQGKLGDCYLLSSIILLAECPFIIYRLFEQTQFNKFGVYGVWLCVDGIWKVVIIDDQFPVKYNEKQKKYEPIFAKNQGPEIWVMLLEKAYAKVFGSYNKISAGLVGVAFSSFTGAPYQYLIYNEPNSQEEDLKQSERVWNFIMTNFNKKYMLGASSDSTKSKDRQLGIAKGHAYSFLDAREVKVKTKEGKQIVQRIVKLMNPWGKKQWKGKWSDKDEIWTPELRNQLIQQDRDDGQFWINIQDFCFEFDQVCACKFNKNYIYTFLPLKFSNEKISFKGIYTQIHMHSHGFITLTQQDHRKYEKQYVYSMFRIKIVEINHDTQNMERYIADRMNCDRDTTIEVNLEPGLYYIALEADWACDITRQVVLNFYGQNGITFIEDVELIKPQESFLNEIISLHSKLIEDDEQKMVVCKEDDKICRIKGEIAGYIYFHYKNYSEHDSYLMQTVKLLDRKYIKVVYQPKQDQFSIRLPPGHQKIIKLRIDNNQTGYYQYTPQRNSVVVEGIPVSKLKALCDKNPTKKKNRQFEGKDIDVIVKTYSYTGGIALLYQNKMDKHAYTQEITFHLQNLECQNLIMCDNKISIHLEPNQQKLLSFKTVQVGKPITFKTDINFHLSQPL